MRDYCQPQSLSLMHKSANNFIDFDNFQVEKQGYLHFFCEGKV